MGFFLLDAGNTRCKWGEFAGGDWREGGVFPTADAAALLAWAGRLPGGARLGLANVAGAAFLQRLRAALSAGVVLLELRASRRLGGVENAYALPERLGADRWAALLGARQRLPAGSSALIVLAGTATTIDFLDAGGVFRGGYILPGLGLMQQSLARGTADLPLAAAEKVVSPQLLPTDTAEAIASGCLLAQKSSIESAFAASGADVCLLAGGNAELIAPHLAVAHTICPRLILEGLLVYAQSAG